MDYLDDNSGWKQQQDEQQQEEEKMKAENRNKEMYGEVTDHLLKTYSIGECSMGYFLVGYSLLIADIRQLVKDGVADDSILNHAREIFDVASDAFVHTATEKSMNNALKAAEYLRDAMEADFATQSFIEKFRGEK